MFSCPHIKMAFCFAVINNIAAIALKTTIIVHAKWCGEFPNRS